MKKGRFFHTYKDGSLNWQGEVLSTTKDTLEVQLFSFLTGEATDILVLPKSDAVWNDNTKTGWKFYSDSESWKWKYAYEVYSSRHQAKNET
jgi:hypothetical protein